MQGLQNISPLTKKTGGVFIRRPFLHYEFWGLVNGGTFFSEFNDTSLGCLFQIGTFLRC